MQYEANITWNEIPPPSPIKPLYRLLANIIYLSGSDGSFVSGGRLIYAGIRLYRRRYGTSRIGRSHDNFASHRRLAAK